MRSATGDPGVRGCGITHLGQWFARRPVRWRLAGASALLTLVILVVFALVVGRLATNRIRGDFDDELTDASRTLARNITVGVSAGVAVPRTGMSFQDFAVVNHAVIRVVTPDGTPIAGAGTTNAVDLGSPKPGIVEIQGLHVATSPVTTPGSLPVYVQYARPAHGVNSTIDRLWFFLFAGVFGGTILAALAGLAVADRAMKPVAELTATAREIAATRDPSRKVPEPDSDDEVAELARTLAQMLHSLEEANDEREQALQRQREFVADASHELRTPLTSVLANLELLQEELERRPTGDSEASEMVSSALGSSHRMRRLVADLLLLARADAGRDSQHLPTDLAEVAEGALREVRPLAEGHELETSVEGPLPVSGNSDELHRVIVNLLDNAVRHTPRGTRVELAGRRAGNNVEISVSDEGPGLDPGMESEVFDRFVRGPGPSDVQGDGGSGLGLAIVKAVADAHGGSVTAARSNGGGARFTLSIPADLPKRPRK
jgi:two-component system, OmpR family, sensor kinase